MSALSTLANSALGVTKKAYLIVYQNIASETITTSDIIRTTDEQLQLAATMGYSANSPLTTKIDQPFHIMEVQYNPSSLSLLANAEPIPFSTIQHNIDENIPNQNLRPPSILLSVELVFDATNLADAFMADKFRMSPADIVNKVAALKRHKLGGYTVQPQTNGLVALLTSSEYRVITFRWGDTAFTGQVKEVQAQYTMFSVSGRPIRSKVNLNMTQQVKSKGDSAYWDEAFNRWLPTEHVYGKGSAQNFGNIANFNAF